MSKKILIPVVIAALAAVVVGLFAFDAAFAKEGSLIQRFKRANGALGQVSEIKNNEFSITKRDGSEMSYHVSDETKFLDRDRNQLTFDDMVEGGWVLVAAPEKEGEKPTARIVVILPEDFNPEDMARYRGQIAGVNVSASEFILKTKDEQEITFSVDDETLFNGQAADLANLEEGMLAQVIAEEQADGSLMAQGVRSSYPTARKVGVFTAVDAAAGTFTIKGRDGLEATFAVDENTKFRSKDGELGGLEDVHEGMVGAVMAVNDPAYNYPLAKVVAATEKENLPKADARFAGKVTAVDGNSFTIQTRDGKTLTFKVTGDTKFRSRDGSVKSLDDLKEGMVVGVGAKELGNGQYQAQVVVAGKGR